MANIFCCWYDGQTFEGSALTKDDPLNNSYEVGVDQRPWSVT